MAEIIEMQTPAAAHVRNDNGPPTPQAQDPETLCLRVAFSNGHSQAIADLLSISSAANGEGAMQALHELYRIHHGRWQILLRTRRAFFMQTLALGAAVITPTDAEAAASPQRVVVESFGANSLLTAAFHDPHLFRDTGTFAEKHLLFATEDAGVGSRALFVASVFSKHLACVWMVVSLIASSIVGFAVGLSERSVVQGVVVGTGLLANLATVQGLIVWMSL